MKGTRRTKIEFVSCEKTVIRVRSRAGTSIFCRDCFVNTTHFSVPQAARILSLSEAVIFRAAEFGQIHSTETASGALFVCSNSFKAIRDKIIKTNGEKKWEQK